MSTFLDRWDEAALQEALASGKVDARDRTGATPLWHAVYFGQVAWVERLLAAGARIDAHQRMIWLTTCEKSDSLVRERARKRK